MANPEPMAVVSLEPRDGLFLKDGRGWFTNESGRAGTLEWPYSGTVRGALRTCLGKRLEADRKKGLSPDEWRSLNASVGIAAVLPLCRSVGSLLSVGARRWPAPRDAVIFTRESHIRPLLPSSSGEAATTLPLSEDPVAVAIENLRHPSPGDIDDKAAAMPVWWPDDAFTGWLCGMPVDAAAVVSSERTTVRVQSHVSIDPGSGAAVDGALFSSTVVEPLSRSANGSGVDEWSVAAIGSGFDPAHLSGRHVRLGGDGRMVTCAAVPVDLFEMPVPLREMFDAGPRGLRLVLVSHASLTHGWLPSWLEARDGRFTGDLPGVGTVVLAAACVGRPVHVSGWDMAAGAPKPTRRLAPAGSVWFLEKADGGAFTAADAEAVWLRAIGEANDVGEATGAVVPGVWHRAR
jgi:CRISPR-associated protein Cmr3